VRLLPGQAAFRSILPEDIERKPFSAFPPSVRLAVGDQFDGDGVQAYPPGSVIVLPGDTLHFHWVKSGEYVTRASGIGPSGLE
jgi:hypothetical protein